MKFDIAQRELKRLAKDKYHSLRFEKSIYSAESNSASETECGVYVDGSAWYVAPTWKEALGLLRNALNSPDKPIEETPEVEDTNEDNQQA